MSLDWDIRFQMQKWADAQEAIESLENPEHATCCDDILITGIDGMSGCPDFFADIKGLIRLCEQTKLVALKRLEEAGVTITFPESADTRQLLLGLVPPVVARVGPTHERQMEELRKKLDTDIGAVHWGPHYNVRIVNALANLRVQALGHLVQLTKCDIRKAKRIGKKGFRTIERTLDGLGLSLEMEVPWWSPPEKHD